MATGSETQEPAKFSPFSWSFHRLSLEGIRFLSRAWHIVLTCWVSRRKHDLRLEAIAIKLEPVASKQIANMFSQLVQDLGYCPAHAGTTAGTIFGALSL